MKHGHRQSYFAYPMRRSRWYAVQGHEGWQVYDQAQGALIGAPTKRKAAHKAARKYAAIAWHGRTAVA